MVNGSIFDTFIVVAICFVGYGAIGWWVWREFPVASRFLLLIGGHIGLWLVAIPIGAVNETAAGLYCFLLGVFLYALPAYINRDKRGGFGGGD